MSRTLPTHSCCLSESAGRAARSQSGSARSAARSGMEAMSKEGSRWTWVVPASASFLRCSMPFEEFSVKAR